MIRSMTGFGAGRITTGDYRIDVQIKTVNQRFFDANFYLPKQLFAAEIELRQLLKKHIARGKTEVKVTLKETGEAATALQVNRDLALSYDRALGELATLLKLPRPNDIKEVAAFDGIITQSDSAGTDYCEGNVRRDLLAATEEALTALIAMREREGAALAADFSARLNYMTDLVDSKLAGLGETIVAAYRERIERVLGELLPEGAEADAARLVQEVALYADRIDFTEEVVRLKSHLAQFGSLIAEATATSSSEPVGRKLDFLLQEINREVNTIGSKANNVTAAQICITLKSENEKLREQVQNIE